MTYPRSHMINPEGGTYHVCSRCVRRSFLCGLDPVNGKDFSHRRRWIEQRIFELSEIFSISVYAYAVMSNHYHLVLKTEPKLLSKHEVAERWLKLCPGRRIDDHSIGIEKNRYSSLLEDEPRLDQLRVRLQSISWFMRFINEPLARMANKEDSCSGRFWEGRFKSQILLDEASVLACMVYVDLNPIRAGIADNLTDSNYTSIQHRLKHHNKDRVMDAVSGLDLGRTFSQILLKDYVSLIKWTALAQKDERSAIGMVIQDCLANSHTNSDHWFRDHFPKAHCWQRAVGSDSALKNHAEVVGQRWIRKRSKPTSSYN